MDTTKLDGTKLKQIMHASHSAEVTMIALAMRERNREFSDIIRTKNELLRSGERIDPDEYKQFWIDMEKAGCGSVIHGRNGEQHRFRWSYALKRVANAAITGRDDIAERLQGLKPSDMQGKTRVIRKRASLSEAEKLQKVSEAEETSLGKEKLVYIPLRKDFHIEIPVPEGGFSVDEIEVIDKVLKKQSA